MERIHHTEKPQEGTSKSTAKAGPKSWETSQYIYQEEPRDAPHDDPSLESALQRLSLHQHPDSDFLPSDEDSDHEALHPAFGIGATHDLSARDSTASDQGTLAGVRSRGGEWAYRRLTKAQQQNLRGYWNSRNNEQKPTRQQKKAYSTYVTKKRFYKNLPDSKYAAKWR
jgi:hypothetical protein